MNIPFTLTPVQHADILQALHWAWPQTLAMPIVPCKASAFTLAAWSLSGEQKNHQPYEELGLIVTQPELTLDTEGQPRFTCADIKFLYQNGYISHGIRKFQTDLTHPVSFEELVDPQKLQIRINELRAEANKIPPRKSAA